MLHEFIVSVQDLGLMVGWWFRLMGMDGKERKNISRLEQNKTKIKDKNTTASQHHIHNIESKT